MKTTPKSLRLQIGIFGRTNVGKSSFLNMVAGQDVAITSEVPGTTTDVVEKTMELLPVGPVVFLDTAGIDDNSILSEKRVARTRKAVDRSDVALLMLEAGIWGEYEEDIIVSAARKKIPVILVVNKTDIKEASTEFLDMLKKKCPRIMECSSSARTSRDKYVNELKRNLIEVCPEDFLNPPAILGDLIPRNGTALLIVPIDMEAPKGRIILPQVQAIRDTLDADSISIIVKESEYKKSLENLKNMPDLVVCDSQVVDKMVKDTPQDVECTTFSILFARYKGDLEEMARGAAAIRSLRPGDKVLISESCSHHAIEDDIGRVKMPKWLKEYVGGDLDITVTAGRDFPEDLKKYKLIIQCGSCMITRRETLCRISRAKEAGVPITNYGVCISEVKGVLERVLSPFPAAIEAYRGVGSRV